MLIHVMKASMMLSEEEYLLGTIFFYDSKFLFFVLTADVSYLL